MQQRVPKRGGVPPEICLAVLWCGVALFIFNEVRLALQTTALETGERQVTEVAAERPDPANGGRLVHVRGVLTARAAAADAVFGAVGNGAVLKRTVEMRQWRKASPRTQGKRVNGFVQFWSEERHDTKEEGAGEEQVNPPMPVQTEYFDAAELRLGGFDVETLVTRAVRKLTPVRPSEEMARRMAEALPGYTGYVAGAWVVLSKEPPGPGFVGRKSDDRWGVGTIRVRFEEVALGPLTVTARQEGTYLRPYPQKGVSATMIVQTGDHSPAENFARAGLANGFMKWGIRFFAMAMTFAGLHMWNRAKELIRYYGPDYFATDGD